MEVGFKFRQKGEDVEIAPRQKGDAKGTVRVRAAGSDNKGTSTKADLLLSKLSDKLNTDYQYIDRLKANAPKAVKRVKSAFVKPTFNRLLNR